MDKRQYCYNYVRSAQCFCSGADIEMLLDESVSIKGLRSYQAFNFSNFSTNTTVEFIDSENVEKIIRKK